MKYFLSLFFADFSLSQPFSRSLASYKVQVIAPVFVSELAEITLVPPTVTDVYFTPTSSFFPISSRILKVSSVTSRVVHIGSSTSIPTVFEADSGIKIKPTNFTLIIERTKQHTRTMINVFLW